MDFAKTVKVTEGVELLKIRHRPMEARILKRLKEECSEVKGPTLEE
jgi:hypothetical protein